MTSYEKLVPDTSVIIEGILSKELGKSINAQEILIHNAVLMELEHQANQEKAIGHLGLEEIKNLKKICKVIVTGRKPFHSEIRNASFGEIDALIRELALEVGAVFYTADKVQAKVAEVQGLETILIKPSIKNKKLKLESYFDELTMSVHIKEKTKAYAKKGRPGDWKFEYVSPKEVSREEIKKISTEIIEEAKKRTDSFIEIERPGSTIIQLDNYRIVILKPPFADGWEITAVRPVKKLELKDYELSEKLMERIGEQAEGILVAGAPGHGKTTFASALAINYASQNKTVKTIEAPRDLVLPDSVTQLAMSHGDAQEIHDILLLSRPDYTIFDEMRNTRDFLLYSDLRLSGIGLLGVMHATKAVDAIQRFVGRIELGMIPHVVDTVIFIHNGEVAKVLGLEMTVKVPSGMTESDLARPIVTISDFETKKLEFEIYSYGEETVVVPVDETAVRADPTREFAAKELERYFSNYADRVEVKVLAHNKVEVSVPKSAVAALIGKQGSNIMKVEKDIGFSIDVKELSGKEKASRALKSVRYEVSESGKSFNIHVSSSYQGKEAEIFIAGRFFLSAAVSKSGTIKLNKKSKIGQAFLEDLDSGRRIEVKV
jgi:ATPase